MSELIPYQSIYLNSAPGTPGIVGSGSAFSVSLAGSPIIPRNGRIVKVAVTTAAIPLTYQGVNSSNNLVALSENNGTTTRSFNVTLIPGQYTSASFATMVGTVFTQASAASGYTLTYTASLSTDTGLLTINVTNASYTITINTTTTTAFAPLGIISGSGNINFTSVSPYVSTHIVNIEGPLEINIRCGNFMTNMYETRVQSESTILAVIPIAGAQYSILSYVPAYPKAFGIVGSRMDKLDFLITDQNGNIINLNGYGITIQLALYDMAIPY